MPADTRVASGRCGLPPCQPAQVTHITSVVKWSNHQVIPLLSSSIRGLVQDGLCRFGLPSSGRLSVNRDTVCGAGPLRHEAAKDYSGVGVYSLEKEEKMKCLNTFLTRVTKRMCVVDSLSRTWWANNVMSLYTMRKQAAEIETQRNIQLYSGYRRVGNYECLFYVDVSGDLLGLLWNILMRSSYLRVNLTP